MDPNQLMTAIVTNGIGAACAAAVLWFAWYRETKTLPKLVEAFRLTHDRTQECFEARNTQALTLFAELSREERQLYERWHSENRTRLDALTVETRENRHYIRDLAHQIGLRQAVEAVRAKQKPPPVKEGDKDG